MPLNSPEPYKSIETLAARSGGDCLVGAGTVLSVEQVERTHAAGGRLVVSPNINPAVIRAALTRDMQVMPGFATATEAFAATEAGAQILKLFPPRPAAPNICGRAARGVAGGDEDLSGRRHRRRRTSGPWLEAGAHGIRFRLGTFQTRNTHSKK